MQLTGECDTVDVAVLYGRMLSAQEVEFIWSFNLILLIEVITITRYCTIEILTLQRRYSKNI